MTRPSSYFGRPQADGVLIILFLLSIHLPLAGMLLRGNSPSVSQIENRRLAEFPELVLSAAGLSTFPTRFNACFEDRFFGRNTLVRWSQLATVHWLGMNPRAVSRDDPFDSVAQSSALIALQVAAPSAAAPGARGTTKADKEFVPQPAHVMQGEDGWLFYVGAGNLDYYRRVRPFRPEELEAWQQAFVARREWLAARGIEYIVVISPNKHTIYPEYMPPSIDRLASSSHHDLWQQRMDSLVGPKFAYDLRPALLAAKSTRRCYHRKDTHWNAFGAHVAYTELMRAVSQRVAVTPTWPIEAFDITISDRPGGDLARNLGLPDLYREEWIELEPRRARQAATVFHRESSDDGTYELRIVEHPDKSLPTALVFHDSFFVRMTPFVGEHFSRLTHAWTYGFDVDLIERERPQLVIQQLVERTLARFVPKNPPELKGDIQLAQPVSEENSRLR